MMKSVHVPRIAIALTITVALSACQTVRMPKLDIVKSPEFSEEAANIDKDYPKVKDAPLAPKDIRSDAQWDKDAQAMQALRKSSVSSDVEVGPTESEGEARYEALKAKAQAYKKDDPSTGPVEGFPKYKPRR